MKRVTWQNALGLLALSIGISSAQASTVATTACPDISQDTQLTLARYVERSLCANLDTRAAWQRVQTQRAQVGAANSGYYPSLNISASSSRDFGDRVAGTDPDQRTLSANASW
ncbi:MAG: TolC family protein, partial [Paraperlucidibaca sp.]|nr:TolC family protein [Paraperlucidibaca sp.]